MALSAVVAGVAAPWAAAAAHGVGGGEDLPLPQSVFMVAAVVVLVATFAGITFLWKRPVLARHAEGVVLGGVAGRLGTVGGVAVAVAGWAGLAFCLVTAFGGSSNAAHNPAPWFVVLVFWLGLHVVSAVVGDVWSRRNPYATLRPVPPPAWGAVAVLVVFAWLDLVYPAVVLPPRLVGISLVAYIVATAATGGRWEGFVALFRMVGAMGVFHRHGEDGGYRLRAPLTGLTRLRLGDVEVAVVLVTMGATTFDGLSGTVFWAGRGGGRVGWSSVPLDTGGLLVTIAVVAAVYLGAMWLAARAVGVATKDMVADFAPSLLPIALAYVLAHSLSFALVEGQTLVKTLSDPFGRGWDLLGTSGWVVESALLAPVVIAVSKAVLIVIGHVAGVVVAHDRAVARFEGDDVARSQYPLLGAMVLYTLGGLVLLLR